MFLPKRFHKRCITNILGWLSQGIWYSEIPKTIYTISKLHSSSFPATPTQNMYVFQIFLCPMSSSRPFRGGETPWDDKLEQPWSGSNSQVKSSPCSNIYLVSVWNNDEFPAMWNINLYLICYLSSNFTHGHIRQIQNPKSVPRKIIITWSRGTQLQQGRTFTMSLGDLDVTQPDASSQNRQKLIVSTKMV